MSPFNKIASFTALSLSLAFAGAGCMAEAEQSANVDQDETTTAADPQATEKTGEAHEAWFPFFSNYFLPGACCNPEWSLLGFPAPFFNGCGFPIHRCF
jgi:hypothetical protein